MQELIKLLHFLISNFSLKKKRNTRANIYFVSSTIVVLDYSYFPITNSKFMKILLKWIQIIGILKALELP